MNLPHDVISKTTNDLTNRYTENISSSLGPPGRRQLQSNPNISLKNMACVVRLFKHNFCVSISHAVQAINTGLCHTVNNSRVNKLLSVGHLG